ncbi:MAG: peptidoglycan-binding protein [Clostridiales bacterium]|nr:peptidoglycan-binding protein [Clostridiales bacterium]
MGQGYLIINVFTGDYAVAIPGVAVRITDTATGRVQTATTGASGQITGLSFDTPDAANSRTSGKPADKFTTVNVEIPSAPGYNPIVIHGVQIFDGITSMLPVRLEPSLTRGGVSGYDEVNIPAAHGVDLPHDQQGPQPAPAAAPLSASDGAVPAQTATQYADIGAPLPGNEVPIPEYITVHLGSPSQSASDVRVSFKDYIKNVASSEIYPTWDESAIVANILAQITFALNRVYTVWYRSRGYNFDITNNTAYDQYFVSGREIFGNISEIVDQIFNDFVRREGFREPYFTSYCNGTTSQCNGLSQWGSEDLARQGYSPIEILRNYYPNDVNIYETDNLQNNYGTYPGYTLQLGSSGEAVRRMQTMLNRISGNWYIPAAGAPDGVFGQSTRDSVVAFQKLRGLPADGVIGKDTWYEITRIYTAAAELAELTSEGERIGIGSVPPTSSISQSSRGQDVVQLQFLLNYISEFYPDVPYVIQDGVYGTSTVNSVRAFQESFGLTADGRVGQATWGKLYDVYNAIKNTVGGGGGNTEGAVYPGTPLRIGSVSSDVALMQRMLTAIGQKYPQVGSLSADGIYGQATANSVTAFQKLFGLSADGVIGPATWSRIVDTYRGLSSGGAGGGGGTSPSVPSYPGTALRPGSAGTNVAYVQKLLSALSGVYPVIPSVKQDGVYGSGTEAAVRAFQRLFGLTADGVTGRVTWDALVDAYRGMPSANVAPTYPGYALRRGYASEAVRNLQEMLRVIAISDPTIPSLTADGVFGAGTERSVLAFQRKYGLSADGVAGKATWDTLASVYNRLNASGGARVAAQSVGQSETQVSRTQALAALYALAKMGI